MSSPATLLSEAGSALTRAQALLERAAADLGGPFEDPLRMLAADAETLRRKVRNAARTTGTRAS